MIGYQHQKIQSEHSQDPGNLTLQILHSENPFLRFNDKQLQGQFCSFSCEASKLVFFPLCLLGAILHSLCRELANDMLISMCL